MNVDFPKEFISNSKEQRANHLINKMSKRFAIMNYSLSSLDRKQKKIGFNGAKYEDGPDQIFIPLDKEFGVCPEYNGKFRDEESRFLAVLTKSKKDSSKVNIQIYKEGQGTSLTEKNLIFSASLINSPRNQQQNYLIDIDGDAIHKEDTMPLLDNMFNYLESYFLLEEMIKREQTREEEILREISEEQSEETADEILEKLWDEGL